MEYIYPHYFYDFQCDASKCSDTCCAGWEIEIDPVSLKKYRKYPGAFGNRLYNSVNWKEKVFEQHKGRCAFLNDENLCDIYNEAGKGMLCKTCTRYPRHYEEYENLREISLSLSCPSAARLILGSDRKVEFLSSCRKTPEEEYEEFDFFLFTKLQEIREHFIQTAQNRSLSFEERLGLILAEAHDLQSRIGRGELYLIDGMLARYKKSGFRKGALLRLKPYQELHMERRLELRRLWRRLYRLEALRSDWPELLKEQEQRLYHSLSQEEYEQACAEFGAYMKNREYEYEQLLVYFLFGEFCGAVYDGAAYTKIKLAAVHILFIRELGMAVWLKNDRHFTLEDQVEISHRYAREVEHSDLNREAVECMASEEDVYQLDPLLAGILG